MIDDYDDLHSKAVKDLALGFAPRELTGVSALTNALTEYEERLRDMVSPSSAINEHAKMMNAVSAIGMGSALLKDNLATVAAARIADLASYSNPIADAMNEQNEAMKAAVSNNYLEQVENAIGIASVARLSDIARTFGTQHALASEFNRFRELVNPWQGFHAATVSTAALHIANPLDELVNALNATRDIFRSHSFLNTFEQATRNLNLSIGINDFYDFAKAIDEAKQHWTDPSFLQDNQARASLVLPELDVDAKSTNEEFELRKEDYKNLVEVVLLYLNSSNVSKHTSNFVLSIISWLLFSKEGGLLNAAKRPDFIVNLSIALFFGLNSPTQENIDTLIQNSKKNIEYSVVVHNQYIDARKVTNNYFETNVTIIQSSDCKQSQPEEAEEVKTVQSESTPKPSNPHPHND